MKPWPRVFQNLRASRETELTNVFPLHVAAGWIGNSAAVAKEHYLSTTEDHFTQAVRPAPETDVRSGSQEPEVDEGGAECGAPVVQNAVQQAAAPKCTEAQERNETQENTGVSFLDALSSIDVHLASIPPRAVLNYQTIPRETSLFQKQAGQNAGHLRSKFHWMRSSSS